MKKKQQTNVYLITCITAIKYLRMRRTINGNFWNTWKQENNMSIFQFILKAGSFIHFFF